MAFEKRPNLVMGVRDLIAVVSCVVALGCGSDVSGGGENEWGGGAEAGGGENVYTSGYDSAREVARIPVRTGCGRLQNECSYVCDDLFASCAPNERQCVEDFVAERLEGYEHPSANPKLAEECAEDVTEASCRGLEPDTPACEYAVVEGCPDDRDAYGRPYSFSTAFRLDELPADIEPYLCEDVVEWYELGFDIDRALVFETTGSGTEFFIEADLLRVEPAREGGSRTIERVESLNSGGDIDGATVGPLERAEGRYVLVIELPFEGRRRVDIRIRPADETGERGASNRPRD